MDTKTRLAALTVSFWVVGCASAPIPQPQASTKGYVFVEIAVTNPEAYEGYKKAIAPMVAATGGRYLVRGGKGEARESKPPAGQVVILEYASFEPAKAFLESPQYQAIIHLRTDITVSRLMIVEGVAP